MELNLRWQMTDLINLHDDFSETYQQRYRVSMTTLQKREQRTGQIKAIFLKPFTARRCFYVLVVV